MKIRVDTLPNAAIVQLDDGRIGYIDSTRDDYAPAVVVVLPDTSTRLLAPTEEVEVHMYPAELVGLYTEMYPNEAHDIATCELASSYVQIYGIGGGWAH